MSPKKEALFHAAVYLLFLRYLKGMVLQIEEQNAFPTIINHIRSALSLILKVRNEKFLPDTERLHCTLMYIFFEIRIEAKNSIGKLEPGRQTAEWDRTRRLR